MIFIIHILLCIFVKQTISMKRVLMIIVTSVLSIPFAHAQLCKMVKPGMTQNEVIKIMGKPDSMSRLAADTTNDSLFIWHYGSQDAVITGGKVDRIIADPKAENALSKQMQ